MVFHDFLTALLIFASLMQSFEEHYLNLNLFLLSPKKKKTENNHVFKAEMLLWSHLVPTVSLHSETLCANICAWEAVLCVSSDYFILDFSLQGFPKKTEITSKHGLPLTSNYGKPLGLFCFVAVRSISCFQVNLKKQSGKWRGYPGKGLGAGTCCAVCKEQASEGFLCACALYKPQHRLFLSGYVALGDSS